MGIADVADSVAIAVRLIRIEDVRAHVARVVDTVAVLVVADRNARSSVSVAFERYCGPICR